MKNFINLRTPLFIGASLIIGIIFGYGVYLGKVFSAVLSAVLFVLSVLTYVIFSVKENKGKSSLVLASIFILFAIFGSLAFCITASNFDREDLGNHVCDVTARVEDITEKEGYRNLILSNVNIGYPENVKSSYKISVTLIGGGKIEFGDVISFTAMLTDRSMIFNGKFNAYDVANGVKYSASLSTEEITVLESKPNVFEIVRIFIRDTLERGLDKEEFSVVYALLTGYSDYMEDETITNFRASGVAHIFAVSGLHIGFLSTALTFLLSKFKMNKVWRAILIIFCLIFYSGVCGFSASSLRSAIMCAVMLLANIVGERYDGITAVGVALIIVLLLFPLQLFFVGFQLSFAVVLAILILSKPTAKLLKFLPEKFASALSTVLVAQVASIPIMIIHFGAFSAVSVLANLVFLPIVSVIFIFSLLSVVLSGLLTLPWILFPLNYVIRAIIFIINAVDFTVFMVGGATIGISLIFYYLAFFVASGMVNLSVKMKSVISVVLAGLFLVGSGAEGFIEYSRVKIYSTSSTSFCTTLVSVKGRNTLIVSNASNGLDVSELAYLALKKGIKEVEDVFILSGEKSADAQVICSSIYNLFLMKNVYVYGREDYKLSLVMKQTFPEINLEFLGDGEVVQGKLNCRYLLDGKGFLVECEGRKAVTFGDVDGRENFYSISGLQTDFAIFYEAEEFLLSKMKAEDVYTYNYSPTYKNAKNLGVILYYLK